MKSAFHKQKLALGGKLSLRKEGSRRLVSGGAVGDEVHARFMV